jgi:1-acyl-sn-glycerol-3-phosphate acyltransferase
MRGSLPAVRWLQLPARALFSMLVWTSSFSVMLVGALGTILLFLLGFPYQKVHVWWTAPVFSQVVRCCTVSLRVHYHPDFDPDVRSVYCQNHINLMDGHVAAAVIPHAFSGLMNAWQFKIPVYGWLMSFSKGIPIQRMRRDKLIEQLSEEARKRKEIGMSILTFPEGHRTKTGRPGPFKRGVFLMARNAGMPIVPIAVCGLYDANNKNTGWLFSPFKRVDVFVGPQFATESYAESEISELADKVRSWITTTLDQRAFPVDAEGDASAAAQ